MTVAAMQGEGAGVRAGWLSRVALALRDVKLAHSVFALPFAVVGVFLALPRTLPQPLPRAGGVTATPPPPVPHAGGMTWAVVGMLALVVACMVLARTWAMLVNRIVDREFDAANARTARRAVASGALSARDAWIIAGACAAGFVVTTAGFWVWFGNPWPLALSAPVLAWIALYSFTKRFTRWSHLFLGGALATSPLAAAIAVRPSALGDTPALWWVSGFVLFWVAGFDVLYALQDVAFDRETGLHSLPSRLGERRAVWVSRAMHLGAAGMLAGAWLAEPRFGVLFGVAGAAVCAMLVFEQWWVSKEGLRGLPLAFGLVNGLVSVALGVAGVIDLLIGG